MTLHVISREIFYDPLLPPLTIKNLVKEPFKEGKRHFYASNAEQKVGRSLVHLLVGCLLHAPLINLITYVALKWISQSQVPTSPVLYKTKEGSIYWQRDTKDQSFLKSMTLIDPNSKEFEKAKRELAWYNQMEEALEIRFSRKHVTELFEKGKKEGCINQSFNTFDLHYHSLIHLIAKQENLKRWIPFICKYDVDLGKQDSVGNTGLIWAIANACNGMAMQILKTAGEGEYIDKKGHGNTALHVAVAKGYKKKSKDGEKLEYSNLDLIQTLISKKANVNLQNDMGNTPLHLACIRRDPEMISALLNAGADNQIKNQQGLTPSGCLHTDYEPASKLLKATVIVYSLDKNEFKKKLPKVLELFKV